MWQSHLIGDNRLDILGYKWLGHNRKDISELTKRLGSGGIGLLVAERLLERFTVQTLDKLYEGILCINMSSKCSGFSCNICVCYLPPHGSTRSVDAEEYFDSLLSQIYVYQNDCPFILCGDYNSRIGSCVDCIERVDNVP